MSSSSVHTAQYFEQLNDFMKEVAAEKTAAHSNTEAGGYVGKSSHPSANVDDSTSDASEGARSAENSADVKGEIPGKSPDDISEGDAGPAQDDRQLNMGTQQSATGEDPSVENDFKGDKDDPGTTHPADTKDGEKFGSLERACTGANFWQAKTAALNLGNDILADFANGYGFGEVHIQKKAQAPLVEASQYYQQVAPSAYKQAAVAPAPVTQQAADAGYQLASVLGMEKLSEEERSAATIEQTIKDASYDADLVGSYLHTLAHEAEKMAEHPLEDPAFGGEAEGEDHDGFGDEASGMEEGGDEAALLAQMAGEGGGDLGGELGGGLGEELGGGLGGGLGGELGGGLGGELGGDEGVDDAAIADAIQQLVESGPEPVSDEELLAQLAMALQESGVPGDELGAAGAEGAKLASALKSFKRSGKFQFKEATNGRERKIRDLMKAHVLELVG